MNRLLLASFFALSPAIVNAAATDCSGTIVTGKVPIVLITNPSPTPNVVLLQNTDTREAIWFSFGAITPLESGLGSFIIPPARSGAFSSQSMLFLTFPATGAPLSKLSVVAATAGHKISCAYW